jgi:hypothetical protein
MPKEAVRTTIAAGSTGSTRGAIGMKTDSAWLVPTAIAVDRHQNIYVADPANNRINKYDENGRFVSQLSLAIPGIADPALIVSDMTTDPADRLYVALRYDRRILVYDGTGKLDHVIDLQGKRICNLFLVWFSCALQIERMEVDVAGNVYLRAPREFVKLDRTGEVIKRWVVEPWSARTFVVDRDGTLYVVQDNKTIEVYDIATKHVSSEPCGAGLSYWEGGECHIVRFIDANGVAYRLGHRRDIGRGRDTVIKIDYGKNTSDEYLMPATQTMDNQEKFGANGSLYRLLVDGEKFSIERILLR